MCNVYCDTGYTMRYQVASYGEIAATFSLATTAVGAQISCQGDYTFQSLPGYCE